MSEFPRYAVVTIALLLISLASGVAVTISNPEAGQQILDMLKQALLGEMIDSTPAELAVTLFLNNLQACTLMFIGGATLGLLTVFIIFSNGVVIGSVMELVRQQQGGLYVAAALVPHGIFEIPAFIVSGTLGLLLARALWIEVNKNSDAAAEALGLGRTFLFVVIPLVAVAAVTEAFITPEIINLVA
ncbi:MAG: stage II sporulation protein M [Methanoregulaceae archaeon]|nr:stage II sporulation protein M [Methanoregulaceae archaeon]